MKTYQVIEAHQGDRAYTPGDPETGTRIADPNVVGHLVTLGLLKEIGDAPDALPTTTEAVSVEDLQAQIAALTQERDDARAELAALRQPTAEHDYERDNLGQVDITKPSTSKDQLLVIAAYEQAEVPEGDNATKAELIKAIQAKRKAAE